MQFWLDYFVRMSSEAAKMSGLCSPEGNAAAVRERKRCSDALLTPSLNKVLEPLQIYFVRTSYMLNCVLDIAPKHVLDDIAQCET